MIEHAHPTPKQYVAIAGILVVLTAIEVSLYYLDIGGFNTFALIILMLIKFALVVGFYMHLRYESGFLNRLFIAGLGAASIIYLVVLLTFLEWTPG